MKSIKALSFDTKQELTILRLVLEERLKNHKLYYKQIQKILTCVLELEDSRFATKYTNIINKKNVKQR
tara:strand:+ start:1148 stop:1351 length:204 start_codon:yes stop_codon:yes gene_type:complete